MTVKERILQLLEKRGWTKYKLAKEAGMYPTTVYDWYNEKNFTPDRESIDSVCLAFEITRAEFYCGLDENQLTADQTALLELFEKVPENKRKIVTDLMQSLAE